MQNLSDRLYTGDGKRRHEPLENAWTQPEPYIAAADLTEAVNIALDLRRPLLLEGEPGCGKTQLAYAVAYELGYPLKACYIRSTTRAQDLLYAYDAVRRLYDIQEAKAGDGSAKFPSRKKYVSLGRLGEAIEMAQGDVPSVVLIDEIDKADIDFPNDLLLVLDRLQFEVTEVEEAYTVDALNGKTRTERKDSLPLILITSNREKELPKPFLRRCLFHYIEFPKEKELEAILRSHFSREAITPLFTAALRKFWALRQQKQFRWRKIPGTSELLDWVHILERKGRQKKITHEKLSELSIQKLPFTDALIKTQSDLDNLRKSKI
ncbi:MAG: MoxR family ATPase [Gammaproteobacteria bacterium]|nr:MoxR family ATPase [Gammaproteobacteria bacterium]